jgi:hypothetical protein
MAADSIANRSNRQVRTCEKPTQEAVTRTRTREDPEGKGDSVTFPAPTPVHLLWSSC